MSKKKKPFDFMSAETQKLFLLAFFLLLACLMLLIFLLPDYKEDSFIVTKEFVDDCWEKYKNPTDNTCEDEIFYVEKNIPCPCGFIEAGWMYMESHPVNYITGKTLCYRGQR